MNRKCRSLKKTKIDHWVTGEFSDDIQKKNMGHKEYSSLDSVVVDVAVIIVAVVSVFCF